MKYLNLSSCVNIEAAMLEATHEQKGIWLDLICYCTSQMNGGRIERSDRWTDTMWARIGCPSAARMAEKSPLWYFSCGTLLVKFYNVQSENQYKRKQKLGKMFAEKRWGADEERKIVKIRVKNGSPIGSSIGSPNA